MKRFNLSTWALMRHQLVRYLIVVLLLGGVYAYFRLGQAEDPDFTVRGMIVQAYWPGATAREVDQEVVARLEKRIQEVPHLDFVDGTSEPGEASVYVVLREDTSPADTAKTFDLIRQKVTDTWHEMPHGVVGPRFDEDFSTTYGSVYLFTGDGLSLAQLRDYVDRARTEMLRADQVGRVNVIGAQDQKVYIEFDNEKLYSHGIDPLQIIQTLRAQNVIPAPADVQTPSDTVAARVSGGFRSVESIRDLLIAAKGRTFRLGDVARIYEGYEDPPKTAIRYRGQSAIGLEVAMKRGGDISILGKSLGAAVDRLRTELPVGVEIHQVANQPKVVHDAVDLFMKSLGEAVLIVLAVSFVSLGLRAGLVVAFSIPLVLAITFIAMWAFGIDLQGVSLGALIIALGLLVDDAMIAVEMMAVRLEKGWHSLRAAAYAYRATAFPMLTGTLITAAGFMPVGLAKSNAGEYTFSIFAVVTIALIASWLVAVFFTPYIGFLLMSREHFSRRRGGKPYTAAIYDHFRSLVGWCVDHRWIVIGATVVIFGASLYGFRFVQQQFFPISSRNELVVDFWLPDGASFSATESQVARFESRLATDTRVADYVSYVGGDTPHFYLALPVEKQHSNYAAIVITAKDAEARDALFRELRRYLDDNFPSVRAHVARLESGPPVGFPVQFRILGSDPATLRGIADQVAAVVRNNPNTRDVYADWNEIVKTVQLNLDQDKARALGVSPEDLGNTVNATLNGLPVTQLRQGERLVDVVLRARHGDRDSLSGLGDIAVRTSGGQFVPLDQLVTMRYGFEQGRIWRRNGVPEITVRADIADNVQAPDVTQQLQPAIDRIAATLPPGYRIETGGAMEINQKSQVSIIKVVPLMLVTIFTLLVIQLRSISGSLRVLVSAPLGVVGVVAALLVFHQPFGFVAMLGVIALAGIIMRNSVILVEHIERLVANRQQSRRAIIDAAVRRLRPVLLTAAAGMLAMLPLSQSLFWRPMAVAMAGGILVATLLTLVFEPAMYAAWFRVKSKSAANAKTSSGRLDDSAALLRAAARGDASACKVLLAAGTDPNCADEGGDTPLMLAAQNGHAKICRLLLEAGAAVNTAKAMGTTALMRAALNGHNDVCKLLIAAGADVRAGHSNVTPIAVARHKGYAKVVQTLRKAGAE